MKLSTGLVKATGAATLLGAISLFSIATTPHTYAASPITVGGKAIVANTDGDTIRVRSGAGTDNGQVAEAHEGQNVTVVAGPKKDAKGNTWYKIDSTNGSGWVLSDFLTGKASSTSETASTKPVAAPAAPAKAAASASGLSGFAKVANTDGDPLRIRTSPSTNGSVVTTFAPNTSVVIKAGPVSDSSKVVWYQISANGVTGWAMGQYLAQSKAPAAPAAEAKPAIV
ncbi:MAG TPA: SH3 domain-containing protein, partial [Chloroflexia bacterium]|nr:SH3 domain-containing protein [Chloroflexia bacterium]